MPLRLELAQEGAFYLIAYCGALRGEEVLMTDLGGLIKHCMGRRKCTSQIARGDSPTWQIQERDRREVPSFANVTQDAKRTGAAGMGGTDDSRIWKGGDYTRAGVLGRTRGAHKGWGHGRKIFPSTRRSTRRVPLVSRKRSRSVRRIWNLSVL